MNVLKQIYPAIAMTVVLTAILGIVYPLAVTGLAMVMFQVYSREPLFTDYGGTMESKGSLLQKLFLL